MQTRIFNCYRCLTCNGPSVHFLDAIKQVKRAHACRRNDGRHHERALRVTHEAGGLGVESVKCVDDDSVGR